ncbi:MAG: GNAT family N-acetyltransferase [Cellvibrionales bacterium]|nr:GNAT family N-acetyltransferase [Cellvibrionales bacterium]
MPDNDLNVIWQCQPFSALDVKTLYDILALRNQVFVVEQNCPYLDIDGEDTCWHHLQGYINETLVAYCRIKLADGTNEHRIGRLVIHKKWRNLGLGHELMQHALTFIKPCLQNKPISLSAQSHLTDFYGAHQFTIEGNEYLEDNIPHYRMIRLNTNKTD